MKIVHFGTQTKIIFDFLLHKANDHFLINNQSGEGTSVIFLLQFVHALLPILLREQVNIKALVLNGKGIKQFLDGLAMRTGGQRIQGYFFVTQSRAPPQGC